LEHATIIILDQATTKDQPTIKDQATIKDQVIIKDQATIEDQVIAKELVTAKDQVITKETEIQIIMEIQWLELAVCLAPGIILVAILMASSHTEQEHQDMEQTGGLISMEAWVNTTQGRKGFPKKPLDLVLGLGSLEVLHLEWGELWQHTALSTSTNNSRA